MKSKKEPKGDTTLQALKKKLSQLEAANETLVESHLCINEENTRLRYEVQGLQGVLTGCMEQIDYLIGHYVKRE